MAYTQGSLIEAVDYTAIARGYMNQNTGLLEGRIFDQWGPGVHDHGLGQDVSNITPPHSIPDGGWAMTFTTKEDMDVYEYYLGNSETVFEIFKEVTSSTVMPWVNAGSQYLNGAYNYNPAGLYYFRIVIDSVEHLITIDQSVVTTYGQLVSSLSSQMGPLGFTVTLEFDSVNTITRVFMRNTIVYDYIAGYDSIDYYFQFNGTLEVALLNEDGTNFSYSPFNGAFAISNPLDLPPGSFVRTEYEPVTFYKQVSLDGRSFEPLVLDTAIHMTPGANVTALQWNALVSAINSCSAHAGQPTVTPSAAIVTGELISCVTDLMNASGIAYNSSGTTALPLSDSTATTVTYSLPWGYFIPSVEDPPESGIWTTEYNAMRVYFQFGIAFSSVNHLRYFFNAGGKLKVSFARSGGSLTLANDEWTQMAADCGSIVVGFKDTVKVGGGNSGNTTLLDPGLGGFYATYYNGLYSSGFTSEQFMQLDGVGDYAGSEVRVRFGYSPNINAGRLVMRVEFNNHMNFEGIGRTVDGDLSTSVVVSYPSDTYIANTWGTAVVEGIATLIQENLIDFFVYDSFLGSGVLSSHNGEIGNDWVNAGFGSLNSVNELELTAGEVVISQASKGATLHDVLSTGIVSSLNYYVSVAANFSGVDATSELRLYARATAGVSAYKLILTVGADDGNGTYRPVTATIEGPAGVLGTGSGYMDIINAITIRLEVEGQQIRAIVDSNNLVSITDTDITGPGSVGFGLLQSNTTTVNDIRITQFDAGVLGSMY